MEVNPEPNLTRGDGRGVPAVHISCDFEAAAFLVFNVKALPTSLRREYRVLRKSETKRPTQTRGFAFAFRRRAGCFVDVDF